MLRNVKSRLPQTPPSKVKVAGKPAKPSASAAAPRSPSWQPKLDRALADKHLSDTEWLQLGSEMAQAAPGVVPPRGLLEAYVNKRVGFDPFAASGAGQLLQMHGYDVPARSFKANGQTVAPTVVLRHVAEGNAAETDPTFEALSQRVKRPDAELRLAVVDGGFAAHPMLRDNLRAEGKATKAGQTLGVQFGTFTDLERQQGAHHGTHVAGIATRGTPRIQASLYAVPLGVVGDPQAKKKDSSVSQVREAMEAAAKGGASVVNVSIETFVTPGEVNQYRALMKKHPSTLFVLGAGNDGYALGSASQGAKTLAESLKAPNLAVVGASDAAGERWAQSNTSAKWVDLAARGEHIASASETGQGLVRESGTSMAAPNVSNLAAKCRLLNPALTPAQVVKLLTVTSDAQRSWKGQVASGGTVNAERAMQAAAALALIADGATRAQALTMLGLPAAERTRLTKALEAL